MASKEDIYANRIFLNPVLPLLKVIVEERESLSNKFKGKTAKVQISAKDLKARSAPGLISGMAPGL